jgi:four helix bundle protein
MHNFKELIVWQKSRCLVKNIYKLTQKFPNDEHFGLTQQIRRAVVSISSNIAEGSGRGTNNDFLHFLDIANGSAFELETQLYLALDLEYISQTELDEVLKELIDVERLIYKFKQSLSKNK